MIYTYLACADKLIEEKQEQVKRRNDRLIQEHEKLPFWRRWLVKEELRMTIINNWLSFNAWVDRRIELQRISPDKGDTTKNTLIFLLCLIILN